MTLLMEYFRAVTLTINCFYSSFPANKCKHCHGQ